MELARQERELRKPKNWGAVAFQNIFQRQQELKNGTLAQKTKVLGLNSKVREVLERYPTIRGPLDMSQLVNELNDEELIIFIQHYQQLEHLIIQSWMKLSANFLRCVSMTISDTLLELDLSFSCVSSSHLEILLVRTQRLQTIRLDGCPMLDTLTISTMVKLIYRSVQELYIPKCGNYINNDCLLWIGGCSGIFSMSLSLLKVLDLSHNEKFTDTGFKAIAKGCKKLTFLNLENCVNLTDEGLISIATSCKRIQLLNVQYCTQITNKSLHAVGKNLKELASLNLARCSLISDKGMKSIALGCKQMQAINCAGLLKLTEESLFLLVDSCSGLLTLNITGCERITVNGLENVIAGLQYVENARTFFGFQPSDEHVNRKLSDNLQMIHTHATRVAEEEYQQQQAMLRQQQEDYDRLLNHSATLIQQYTYRYKRRLYFYYLSVQRKKNESTLFIQRLYRGFLGRRKAIQARIARAEFYAKAPYATTCQRNIRGFLARLKTSFISKGIREMYFLREKEVKMAMVVKIQAVARKFLGKRYVATFRELYYRRKRNEFDAILIIQLLVRRFISKVNLVRRQFKKRQLEQARYTAGMKIQIFVSEGMKRYREKLTGEDLKRYFFRKWRACENMQRYFRGFRAREYVKKLRILEAVRYFAARQIQRVFRGSRILYYKDLRLNIISAFILDRFYVERLDRHEQCQKRYQGFLNMVRQDSASEPDTEDDTDEINPWTRRWDVKKKMFYYVNFITNEITYDEPLTRLAHEKDMVGKRVKVYWLLQATWYEGYITRYHKRKKRHRVEYDDGDHEWMNLEAEGDRVQILMPDGSWTLYSYYQSEGKINELRKVEDKQQRDDYKAQAFHDAKQWKAFVDDKTMQVMFLSEVNGEIRAGVPDAMSWIVQDDGFGFPCFFHVHTEQIVYDDPRFTYELDEDVIVQRKYVLQELRYAVYICKDLWEEYSKIAILNDPRQLLKIKIKIRNSSKPIHLNSFLIRAKGLFEPVSIMDKPIELNIKQELEYASWLSQRLSEIISQTEEELRKRKDNKAQVIDKLTANNDQVVHCRYCKRETKKHLAYCPTCGKPQVFL